MERLLPERGNAGLLLSSVYLSKAARYILGYKRPEAVDWVPKKQPYARGQHPITLHWGERIVDRFSDDDSARLLAAFAPLDDALRSLNEQYLPGFQGGPSPYVFDVIPEFTLEDLYRHWQRV